MRDEFILLEADVFDARRGFKRWILPGTVAILSGHPEARAELWTNRAGRLFARFSSVGYIYHFEILSSEQSALTVERQDAVENFLQNKLVSWMNGGIDDSVLEM